MSTRKDKEKVLGEHFDDERIKTFLQYTGPVKGTAADYHLLERAYRGMRSENFATFIHFFQEAGRDLNAIGSEGKTLLQTIKAHRLSDDYVQALEAAGAQ